MSSELVVNFNLTSLRREDAEQSYVIFEIVCLVSLSKLSLLSILNKFRVDFTVG